MTTTRTNPNQAKINALAKTLANARDIAIVSHISPDGDTLGSALALWQALCLLGKQPYIYCAGEVPHLYRFLPGSEHVTQPAADAAHEMLVVVDCADSKRMGPLEGLLDRCQTIGWVDHHLNSDGLKYELGVVDVTASSVGEMMLQLIIALEVPVTKQVADCLYAAISTDTGNFSYSNTRGDTLRAVAQLVDAGAQPNQLAELLYRRRTLSKTRLIGAALSLLNVYLDGRLTLLALPMDTMQQAGATDDECEGLIDYARDIEGVEMAIFLRETPEGIKVSLRSKNQALNVQQLAAAQGGGGHHYAAGCTLRNTTLKQAAAYMMDEGIAMIKKAGLAE